MQQKPIHAAVEFDVLCQLRPTAAVLDFPTLTRKRSEVTCTRCLGFPEQIQKLDPPLPETTFLWIPPVLGVVSKLSITKLDDHERTDFPWRPGAVRLFLTKN